MNPYKLINKYDDLSHGLSEAERLLNKLTQLGVDDDFRIGIVANEWQRTPNGFTWNELFTASSDFNLIQFCGGLSEAKAKVDRAIKDGFLCIDVPHEDGFADVLVSTVVDAIKRIENGIKSSNDQAISNCCSSNLDENESQSVLSVKQG